MKHETDRSWVSAANAFCISFEWYHHGILQEKEFETRSIPFIAVVGDWSGKGEMNTEESLIYLWNEKWNRKICMHEKHSSCGRWSNVYSNSILSSFFFLLLLLFASLQSTTSIYGCVYDEHSTWMKYNVIHVQLMHNRGSIGVVVCNEYMRWHKWPSAVTHFFRIFCNERLLFLLLLLLKKREKKCAIWNFFIFVWLVLAMPGKFLIQFFPVWNDEKLELGSLVCILLIRFGFAWMVERTLFDWIWRNDRKSFGNNNIFL